MNSQTVDLDYCGIVLLLRKLIDEGGCSRRETKRVAERIAAKFGVSVIFPL